MLLGKEKKKKTKRWEGFCYKGFIFSGKCLRLILYVSVVKEGKKCCKKEEDFRSFQHRFVFFFNIERFLPLEQFTYGEKRTSFIIDFAKQTFILKAKTHNI